LSSVSCFSYFGRNAPFTRPSPVCNGKKVFRFGATASCVLRRLLERYGPCRQRKDCSGRTAESALVFKGRVHFAISPCNPFSHSGISEATCFLTAIVLSNTLGESDLLVNK
jgi:hypothetical protein